ncbi:MAG: YcaQ family DNA glycosylase [Lachnospiraceae bacterium]|nr:YcaQ family DNA glycosylase [Lachnospiraceae bacterium]
MMIITKQQARQFILAKQGLIGTYRFLGKEGAASFVRQAGCIQYDPVDVCGKNAELTLQSRVKGFSKTMLHELLYEDRMLVDYADKELSIWPVEDWPYFSSYRERSRKLGETFEGLEELKKKAISYISENGPVSSDSLPIEGEIFWHSSMHWSGNWHKPSPAARPVLEQLYTDGELIIHHKKGSRKFYDLASIYLPASLLQAENPCKNEESFVSWRVLRRIGAVGLLWDKNSTAFLGIDLNAEKRKRILGSLMSAGDICSVAVEGIKTPFYYRSEDDPLMRMIIDGNADLKPRMSFMAPLDPLFWDKSLITSLWDFQYSWEIYTPAAKRKYGYYTLPVLYGDRFIGRIETAADRKNSILCVKGLWWEPGIRRTKKLDTALERTLRTFCEFNECQRVEMAISENGSQE